MEILSLICSVIAIIISVIATYQTKSINSINLSASYYSKIFDLYFIERIPEAWQFLWFDSKGKLTYINELSEVLTDLKKDALYFKYNNPNFYEELCKKTDALEDYIMELANKSTDASMQEEKKNGISALIENIYYCIDNSQKGWSYKT